METKEEKLYKIVADYKKEYNLDDEKAIFVTLTIIMDSEDEKIKQELLSTDVFLDSINYCKKFEDGKVKDFILAYDYFMLEYRHHSKEKKIETLEMAAFMDKNIIKDTSLKNKLVAARLMIENFPVETFKKYGSGLIES